MKDIELLANRSPKGPISLMRRVYKYILPEVDRELAYWQTAAESIPDAELKRQALASMQTKKFHCQGGSVYAVVHLDQRHVLVPLIVALQTISDYLDNLCDRSISLDPADFRLLHQSMLDAVTPGAPSQDYYLHRESPDDGGYLSRLVDCCQQAISHLPAYGLVQGHVLELVRMYVDLQVYKHIDHSQREDQLLQWWAGYAERFPGLRWHEFAAATGSTLGMFMLFLAASDPKLTTHEAQQIRIHYFPSICGLHILLDYLIDQAEDILGGDLNFCSYYDDEQMLIERMGRMVDAARESARELPFGHFHRMIVEGLIALYLSDPKVKGQAQVQSTARRLMKGSPWTRVFFWLNSHFIRRAL